jgi:hypothetical protein
MTNELNVRIVNKKDTEQNWNTNNPVLLDGEIALVETADGVRIKVGNGNDSFQALSYVDNAGDFIDRAEIATTMPETDKDKYILTAEAVHNYVQEALYIDINTEG